MGCYLHRYITHRLNLVSTRRILYSYVNFLCITRIGLWAYIFYSYTCSHTLVALQLSKRSIVITGHVRPVINLDLIMLVRQLNLEPYLSISLVLWFEHSGMTEMLPHAWDTRSGFLSFTFIPDISTALKRPRRPKQYWLQLVIYLYTSTYHRLRPETCISHDKHRQ